MELVRIQLSAFVVLLFTGMVWGGFFDLYRVFRSRIRVNPTVNFIGDLVFWFLTALLVIPLIFWGSWLELRLYVWIAISTGLLLYFVFLSRIFIPIFKVLWQIVGWLPGVLANFFWRLGLIVRRVHNFWRHKSDK
jgi:spore cortex biosynthesis protein YabQ